MTTIEFIGGPYDGYRQDFACPAQCLMAMVSLPISRNVLEVITESELSESVPVKQTAVYELKGRSRYEFLAALPSAMDWTAWCQKVVEAWERQRSGY